MCINNYRSLKRLRKISRAHIYCAKEEKKWLRIKSVIFSPFEINSHTHKKADKWICVFLLFLFRFFLLLFFCFCFLSIKIRFHHWNTLFLCQVPLLLFCLLSNERRRKNNSFNYKKWLSSFSYAEKFDIEICVLNNKNI